MSGSIGGVDASIPLRAGQGVPPNPLTSNPQGFINTLQGVNQLKLFPLEQQRQQIAIQQQQTALQTAQLGQRLTRLNSGIGLMLPLLMDKTGQPTTGVSTQDIAKALADGSNPDMGLLTAGQAAGLLQTLPEGGADPAKNRQWLLQMYSSVRAAAGEHEAALAQLGLSPTTRDTGQAIVSGGVAGPLTAQPGAFTGAGQPTQVSPSRAQGLTPATWKDKNGVEQQGNLAEYTRQLGMGNVLGPAFNLDGSQAASPPASAPAQSAPAGVIGADGKPVSPQNPPRLAPQGQPSAPLQGPLPGTPEFYRDSATQLSVANARGGTFQTDMFPLNQAMIALQTAPTGKGSEVVHNVSSLINTFAPKFLQDALSFVSPIMTKDEVSAYDEAKKYLTQGQLGSPGATRSNEGLTTAGAASPSTQISKEAAQLVLRGMIGLRRMEQESTLEFNNSGRPPGEYSKFQTQFATKADPRVYTFDLMDPAARSKLIQGMTPAARTKFWDQVHSATENGILTQPSAPNG